MLYLISKIKQYKYKKILIAYFFLFPALFYFAFFWAYPMYQVVSLSFQRWNYFSPPEFIGLANFKNLIKDKYFWASLKNTLYLTLLNLPIGIPLAFSLAALIKAATRGSLRSLFRLAYFIPTVIPMVVTGLIFKFLFFPEIGVVNALFDRIGIPTVNWLGRPTTTRMVVVIASICQGLGWNMVIFLAYLLGINETLYEAARIDGANAWACFRFITIPMARPVILLVIVLSTIACLQIFDQIFVITKGGPMRSTETIVWYLYQHGFVIGEMGYAAVVGIALFVVTFIFSLLQLRIIPSEVGY